MRVPAAGENLFFTSKLMIFLYEIYYFHRFYRYILIEFWGFHEKYVNLSKNWKIFENFEKILKIFLIKIFFEILFF